MVTRASGLPLPIISGNLDVLLYSCCLLSPCAANVEDHQRPRASGASGLRGHRVTGAGFKYLVSLRSCVSLSVAAARPALHHTSLRGHCTRTASASARKLVNLILKPRKAGQSCSVENTPILPISLTCQGRLKTRSLWPGRRLRPALLSCFQQSMTVPYFVPPNAPR